MIADQMRRATFARSFSACAAMGLGILSATPAAAQSTTNQPIVIGGGEKDRSPCAKTEAAPANETGDECLSARIAGKQQPRPLVDRFGLPEPGGVNRLMLESPLARPNTPKPSKPILPR